MIEPVFRIPWKNYRQIFVQRFYLWRYGKHNRDHHE